MTDFPHTLQMLTKVTKNKKVLLLFGICVVFDTNCIVVVHSSLVTVTLVIKVIILTENCLFGAIMGKALVDSLWLTI